MNGIPHCCLTLMPVPEHYPLNLIGYGASVIVQVTQNIRQRVATFRQLMDLFSLTPVEAGIARALTQGEDIEY